MRFHRKGGILALLTLAAALAVALAPGEALAGTRKRKLQPPAATYLQEASGRVSVKDGKNSRRIDVRAKGLTPSHSYTVRDTATGEDLGSLATNRKGRGKLRVREGLDSTAPALRSNGGSTGGGRDDGSGGDGSSCGDDVCIVVIDEETGEYVLQCEDLGEPTQVDLEFGYEAYWGDDEGVFGSATLFRAAEGDRVEEGYSIAVETSVQTDDAVSYDLYEIGGDLTTGLPLGVESVKDLEGRAFEIRDTEGNVVLKGDLPSLESFGEVPVFDPSNAGGDGTEMPRAPDPIDDSQPYSLWIADDDGVMTEVGALSHLYHEDFDLSNCPGFDDPIPDYGSGDGTTVRRSNGLR